MMDVGRMNRIGRTPGEVMTKGYIPAAQLYDNPEQVQSNSLLHKFSVTTKSLRSMVILGLSPGI